MVPDPFRGFVWAPVEWKKTLADPLDHVGGSILVDSAATELRVLRKPSHYLTYPAACGRSQRTHGGRDAVECIY